MNSFHFLPQIDIRQSALLSFVHAHSAALPHLFLVLENYFHLIIAGAVKLSI